MNKPQTGATTWRRRLAAVATGLALVLFSGSAVLADHAWGPYHWERSGNPLNLDIRSNLTAYGGNLDAALIDWDRSTVLSFPPVSTGAGLDKCGAVNGRVEVCNDAYGYRRGGWLGVATIWADGGHIVKATVQLNDTFLGDGAPYSSNAWRQMVMCQEIGHTFGLDHQDEDFYNANLDTCMDYTNRPDSNQDPNAHDYQMLEGIYGHPDGSTSGGGGDSGCNPRKPGCSGAAPKAPSFSQASRANGSVYVDRMRNGLTRVKHVFWVPPR